MRALPRRTIEELFAKYELHPEICDIFVEGEFDRSFLRLFLQDANLKDVSVFSIDDIDIPESTTAKHGLTAGSNRNRVISLAKELDSKYVDTPLKSMCIADADCDRVLSKSPISSHIALTDYTCMEGYFANPLTLTRFLDHVCQLNAHVCDEFLHVAHLTLPAMFALRATRDTLQLNEKVPDHTSGLLNKKDFNSFDPNKYLNAFLSAPSIRGLRPAVSNRFNEVLAALPSDLRHKMQGHDFIKLFFDFIWSKGKLKLQDKNESVESYGSRLLSLAYHREQTAEEPLFSRIKSVMAPKPPRQSARIPASHVTL